MVRPALQLAVLAVLITTMLLVHQLAKFLVHEGVGVPALVLLLLSTPLLSRYLD